MLMVNVVCHTVKRSGFLGGGGTHTIAEIQCEIILDMFGKSSRLMTPAGEEGMAERIDSIGCVTRVTHAFLCPEIGFSCQPARTRRNLSFLLEQAPG